MQEVEWTDRLTMRGHNIPLVAPIQDRDYQRRVVEKFLGYVQDDGLETIMVESPTGSGKTAMALSAIRCLEVDDDEAWRKESYDAFCGWMTMRRTNLAQARRANDSMFGVRSIEYVSMFDRDPPRVKILVSDEAQHDSASSCVTIHATAKPKWVLGLTATPFRTDQLKLAFQKQIKDSGIHRLIEDGWLSRFHHFTINKFDVPSVARHYLRSPNKWGKTAVYWHRIADCHAFANCLNRAGIHAEVVDGATRDPERILFDFSVGAFPVLTSVAKLTEGFDEPGLQTVFVRDASRLPTIQMCGRVLRIAPGKKHANIVQSKDSKWQFPKTAKPAKGFVWRSGKWLCLGSSKIVTTTATKNSKLLAAAPPIEMPDFLLKKMSRREIWGAGLEHQAGLIPRE